MKISIRKELLIPGLVAPVLSVVSWAAIVWFTDQIYEFKNRIILPFLIFIVPIVALPIVYLYTFCVTVPLLRWTGKSGQLRKSVLYATALGFSFICVLLMLVNRTPFGLASFYFVWLFLPCSLVGAISFHILYILLGHYSTNKQ